MLDFGLMPPEVNSGRMYWGPGAGPLLAAAEAWDGLATELGFATAGYGATLAELTGGPWIGPTSLAMIAAATPYVEWMRTTAAQAEESANHARAAVAAYEAAFAMHVPPPVIAANRALLAALVATNFFGQNTPAIMATEALYVEMWAQDAAAMYGYAAASATANQVTPFAVPPQTTSQDTSNNQADAASNAATQASQAAAQASQAATAAQSSAGAAPSASSQAAASGASSGAVSGASTAVAVPVDTGPFAFLEQLIYNTYNGYPSGGLGLGFTNSNITTFLKQTLQAYFGVGLGNFGFSIGQQLTYGQGTTAGSAGAFYATPQFASLYHGGPVRAGFGGGNSIGGRLSVPGGWAVEPSEAEAHPYGAKLAAFKGLHLDPELAANPTRAVTAASNTSGAAAAHAAAAEAPPASNGVLGGVPMGGTAGGRGGGFTVKYGFKHAVIPRPPSAG